MQGAAAAVQADGAEDLAAAWVRHMRAGEWSAAWRVSDRVLAGRAGQPSWHLPRHEQWIWDGTPLDGKRVIVRCYHGLGDTLQFIRYAPLLRDIGVEATFWVQPALIPLLRTVSGIGTLLPLHDGEPGVDYDADVEIMELSHVFRSTQQTLPADVPICTPILRRARGTGGCTWGSPGRWAAGTTGARSPSTFSRRWRRCRGWFCTSFSAGRVWRSGPPASAWTPVGRSARGRRNHAGARPRSDGEQHAGTPGGRAGRPVWSLLQSEADWRWMDHRDDSPWYPTMRLFRQPGPGVGARDRARRRRAEHLAERMSRGEYVVDRRVGAPPETVLAMIQERVGTTRRAALPLEVRRGARGLRGKVRGQRFTAWVDVSEGDGTDLHGWVLPDGEGRVRVHARVQSERNTWMFVLGLLALAAVVTMTGGEDGWMIAGLAVLLGIISQVRRAGGATNHAQADFLLRWLNGVLDQFPAPPDPPSTRPGPVRG